MPIRRNIFAPLALVAAIFIAIAAALYFYAVPHPVWTTASPKVQGDFEFLGVYKGVPRHLAKFGIDGFSDVYTGNLWAYFRVNRNNLGEIHSRIVGTSGAETAFTNQNKNSMPKPNGDPIYLAVPMPSEYPAELQNGKLELSDGKKTLGTWRLTGMAAPKDKIDPLEPNVLKAEALGHRMEMVPPFVQRFEHSSNPLSSANTTWYFDLRVASGKLDPRDKYEYEQQLKRTSWSKPTKTGWTGSQLPANGTTSLSLTDVGCLPSKRIEIALNVVRFRTAPDSITLYDVVLERDKSMPQGSRSYSFARCSEKQIVSKEGIRFELGGNSTGGCGLENVYGIQLISHEPLGKKVMANSSLSKSLNLPIKLSFGTGGTSNIDTKWEFTIWRPLPVKSSARSIKLKTLVIQFDHKAKLEEKTVTFLGPTT